MAITEYATSQILATNTTETTVSGSDENEAGVYQVFLDYYGLNPPTLPGGSRSVTYLSVKIYEKARSGDTQRLSHELSLSLNPSNPNLQMMVTPPVLLSAGWKITVRKTIPSATVQISIRKAG
jgi:hypothetical protein